MFVVSEPVLVWSHTLAQIVQDLDALSIWWKGLTASFTDDEGGKRNFILIEFATRRLTRRVRRDFPTLR